MDYPIKTLGQLRPILQGFRKAAGLTQAMMASHLGVTQQTYAQLEANPAAVSVDRLFRVLRVLDVDLTLTQTAVRPKQDGGVGMIAAPPSPGGMPAEERLAVARPAKTASAAGAGRGKRTPEHPRKKETAAKRTSATTTRKGSGDPGPDTRRSARETGGVNKKRENW
ncbi:helix-turn-helix transcriptional regulator [Paraburkholderia sp. BL10I2N1]|uniref:helix-turn-helix domain-containing protein n=1 Tax=Paraburkholderia sp. BL10I2N1 TaxID=1938796 RepID=UPI00105F8D04|nr:helix-turn-helix transcriptional regulator [Paraburkholderia sp. BL10I2N1]TDN69932.1 HTH-type transcriptional regulator/antitoxin HipB [Paraburkholderia sp. BL10I2N1]